MKKKAKVKIHVPVIFYKQNGKLLYDHHGTFGSMVSNARKRQSCEYDFLSCFMADMDSQEGFDPLSVKLVWITVEVDLTDLDETSVLRAKESTATPKSVELV